MRAEDPEPLPDSSERLSALVEQAHRQAELGSERAEPWASSRDGAHPVLIVGAGQAGLALAQGLRRKGVGDVMIIDESAEGLAGPWMTYARMRTLRTPKNTSWPTWGIPAASPRAWFEAVFGPAAWNDLEYYPTHRWHEFLQWYRVTFGIDVKFGTSVEAIQGGEGSAPYTVRLRSADGVRLVRAEHVVLATGLEGAGGRRIPAPLFSALPAERWAHSHDAVDFAALRGARIGVLGGGTGAFDNAATALEAGASSAEVHMRRAAMPTASPYRWMEFAGLIDHYDAFTDRQKWLFNAHLARVDQPATQNAIWRAYEFSTFSLCTSSPWSGVEWDGDEITVSTPHGVRRFDFVIAATGITVDLGRRSELAAFVSDIALWGDRLPVDECEAIETPELASYPYLSSDFGLVSRSGDDDRLGRIHLFNHGARMSLGVLSHQISGIHGGAERLVAGIGESLFARRSADLLDEFTAYDVPVGVVLGRRPRAA